MLPPGTANTFEEYSTTVFVPFILKKLESVRRVHLVWDIYRDDSLKKPERDKRGSGQRRKVMPATRISLTGKAFYVLMTIRVNCSNW